jgi:vancomycin resistance protein YoaR
VSYYEQDRPVGFDAAIYQPSWDFRFKNDTEHSVLVQTEADVENFSLTFKIYGTSDGREVKITEPEITGQSPPPPALYQDDPTLAKGIVRQVDFPAWGAKVRFSRTVTRGGEELFVDTYESRYQPWRAVYLVGTKE